MMTVRPACTGHDFSCVPGASGCSTHLDQSVPLLERDLGEDLCRHNHLASPTLLDQWEFRGGHPPSGHQRVVALTVMHRCHIFTEMPVFL